MIAGAVGFIIGFLLCWWLDNAVIYPAQVEKKQREKCNECWSEMYDQAWTLTLDGHEYKVLPIFEYGHKEEPNA